MVTGLFIPADADEPVEAREFKDITEYQLAVGGWLEAIEISALGTTVFVNEEGRQRRLPFNSRATFLWWYHEPTTRNVTMLVGDAIVVGAPNRLGESTSVPADLQTLATANSEFLVLVKVGTVDMGEASSQGIGVHIVLPILRGDPSWVVSVGRYDDYFSAAVWAMTLVERWSDATETRIVRASDLWPKAT